MRIAVVGSGYVGLVAGACFADLGHDVVLVDNDERKLSALMNGQVPIHENFLPELLSRHRGHRLTFSDDLQEAVRASSAIFVAVGTPPTERVVMPPRRPDPQASAKTALYFSDPVLLPPKRPPAGAFDRLKAANSTLTAD